MNIPRPDHDRRRPFTATQIAHGAERWHPGPGIVYDVAKELARPIVSGVLPLATADATVLLLALNTDQGPYDPIEVARHGAWILRTFGRRIRNERNLTAHRIERQAWRLVDRGALSADIQAAAEAINDAAGDPLTPDQVRAEVLAVFSAVVRKCRRHG